MNDETPVTREEILIGRIVDGEAAPSDWRDLESLAAADPFVWRRLADAQRDSDVLRLAFERASSPADRVDVGDRARASAAMSVRVRSWSGWAAAAAVALAWAGLHGVLPVPRQQGSQAAILPSLTPDEALDQYIAAGQAEGRVLAEGPKVMVEIRPAADGKRYEVLFNRQILERATVNALCNFEKDEHGRTVLAPASRPHFTAGDPI